MRLAIVITCALAACTGDTGGDRVAFDTRVLGVAPVTGGAITYDDPESGWRVSLTTARVLVGPVYLWSGRPLGQTVYFADQFEYGFLRGQVVTQAEVDLIATAGVATSIATGDGLAGEALSAELWLAPAASGDAPTFEVAGTATRDTTTVAFHGTLTIDDAIVDESTGDTAFERRKVRGIPLTADVQDGGTLTIACDARRWLAGADFAIYAAASPAEITFPDPVWGQWFYQVRQSRGAGPWTLTWEAP